MLAKWLSHNETNYQKLFYLIAPLLAFCCFVNTLEYGFVYDDFYHVVKAGSVFDDWSIANLKRLLTTDFWSFLTQNLSDEEQKKSVYYRPFLLLCLMANYAYAGATAWKWHITAILLHVVATSFAYQLLLTTLLRIKSAVSEKQAHWLTLIATIVFAVHPLQSESVAWISAYANALMAIIIFSSLLAYLKARSQINNNQRIFLLLLSVLLYSLALLTKETGMLTALLLFCYELILLKEELSWRKHLTRAFILGLPFLFVTLLYFFLRFKFLGAINSEVFSIDFPEFSNITQETQLFTLPIIIFSYLKNIIFPVSLSPFYPVAHVFQPNLENFYLPLLLLLVIAIFLIIVIWRNLIARLGFIWLFVALLPTLNISAFTPEDLMHDRYLYFSLLGAGLLLAEGFRTLNSYLITKENKESNIKISFWPLRPSLTVVLAVLLIVMMASAIKQNHIWESEWSFWLAAQEGFPNSCIANKELARLSFAENLEDQAINYYEQAKNTCPYSINVLQKLGLLYARRGDFKQAEAGLQKVIQISPHPNITSNAYYSLAIVYRLKKDKEQAIKSYQKAIEFNPTGSNAKKAQRNIEELMSNN